jgi:Zn-dependent membrane protease YugP
MHILLPIAIILVIVFGPQLWAKHVLRTYSVHREDIPGSGGELARHLLAGAALDDVVVEETELGDHYDPNAKAVRLSKSVMDGKSLTAIATAAHEVGHAIQDHIGYGPLRLRSRLVNIGAVAERIGSTVLVALPFVIMLSPGPLGPIMLVVGLAVLAIPVLIHAVTLPVEFDASFRRALPILAMGYVPEGELRAARRILLACALTYVAQALVTLLNFCRWIAILRR